MTRAMEDAKKRFEFQAKTKSLYYDLRLVSTTAQEWESWKNDLMEMSAGSILEMYRATNRFIRRSEINIFSESEQIGETMVFRFYSDAGKVEVLFDLNPRTLEITYRDVVMTQYEETFSLLV